jgi:hypothetical protein
MALLRLSLLALALFGLVAHANTVEMPLPGFQCQGMSHSVRLPGKLSQLRALGRVTEEQTVHVQEWDGYKTVEKMLRFEGLYVQVITFSNDPERYSLAALHLESPKWQVSPFRIGQPTSEALARLGAKGSSPTGTWRFSGESETLHIESSSGRLFRVVYECYTG